MVREVEREEGENSGSGVEWGWVRWLEKQGGLKSRGGEKPEGWTLQGVGVSQPEGSNERPNPQVSDITSSPRPGPTASPSPSLLPGVRGEGGAGLTQKRPPYPPTH